MQSDGRSGLPRGGDIFLEVFAGRRRSPSKAQRQKVQRYVVGRADSWCVSEEAAENDPAPGASRGGEGTQARETSPSLGGRELQLLVS